MSFDEEFDRIIRKKAEELNFPFDEKNWEKAAAMLNAERNAVTTVSRRGKVIYVVLALLFMSALMVGVNYFTQSPDQKTELAENNENKKTVGNIASANEQEIFLHTNIPVSKNQETVNKAGSSSESHKTDFSAKKKTNRENSNENFVSENSFENSSLTENLSVNENTSNSFSEIEFQETEFQNESENEHEIFTLIPIATEYTPVEEEITNLPFTALKRYDDYYSPKPKTHYLNVEAGGVYLLGWKTKNGTDGAGADWYAGMNYGRYFTRKISVSAGLQAYNIRNINQAFFTAKKTEYDFGSVTSNTIITTSNLYYLAVPLKINYAFNTSQCFGIGLNAGYAIDSKNSIQTYEVKENNTVVNYRTVKNTGLYKDINSFNVMLTASYRGTVSRRLFVNAEFIYSVSDIFRNNKNIKTVEQPSGIRIGLQYNLFDK